MSAGQGVAASGFGQFMASGAGRLMRIVAGIALIVVGLVIGGTLGWILFGVGFVPLAAGVFDMCLITGLLSRVWTGKGVRACKAGSGRTTGVGAARQ